MHLRGLGRLPIGLSEVVIGLVETAGSERQIGRESEGKVRSVARLALQVNGVADQRVAW